MQEKEFVALEAAICPVCGVKHNHNCSVLLDTSFNKGFDKTELITHYGMCEEHDKMLKQGFVFCIAIDIDKTIFKDNDYASLNDVYRTGKLAVIKREVAEQMFPEVQDIMFVTDEFIEELHAEYNKQTKCN